MHLRLSIYEKLVFSLSYEGLSDEEKERRISRNMRV
jgi:hypothetical protein